LLLVIYGWRLAVRLLQKPYWFLATKIIFSAFRVEQRTFQTNGLPYVFVKNGSFIIGKDFKMNNHFAGNIIGRQQKCIFVVNRGHLKIGNNVGMSSTAIICHNQITIGDNVRIGGNTVIYDTDFHSLDYRDRINIPEIKDTIKTKPVHIGENVFIGAHTTILKGTFIGNNSIIGAGSLVSGHIPENEIWGGNPANFIKKINVTTTS
jgi:acetyltransferase-like isoleucine patch superfamily enzyme